MSNFVALALQNAPPGVEIHSPSAVIYIYINILLTATKKIMSKSGRRTGNRNRCHVPSFF